MNKNSQPKKHKVNLKDILQKSLRGADRFPNDPERAEAFDKYKEIRNQYMSKAIRGKNYSLWLKFTQLFITIALLILSLIQIRYNIFPVQTIGYYIAISVIFSFISFLESVISLTALRSWIADAQSEVSILSATIEKAKDSDDPDEILKIYNDIASGNFESDSESD